MKRPEDVLVDKEKTFTTICDDMIKRISSLIDDRVEYISQYQTVALNRTGSIDKLELGFYYKDNSFVFLKKWIFMQKEVGEEYEEEMKKRCREFGWKVIFGKEQMLLEPINRIEKMMED